jgi:hypothetical protein
VLERRWRRERSELREAVQTLTCIYTDSGRNREPDSDLKWQKFWGLET